MLIVYILISLAAIVVLILLIAATQPSEFHVERTAMISAPRSEVFAQVNDLHKWEAWSPWANLDPTMKQTYEGAPAGTGAVYYWNGNRNVGEGRMTITESLPNELVRIKLEFMRPFAGTNDVDFTFKPEGNQTRVTWTMVGAKVFITKVFGLFVSMDKMIGGMFDKGLGRLKEIAEARQG